MMSEQLFIEAANRKNRLTGGLGLLVLVLGLGSLVAGALVTPALYGAGALLLAAGGWLGRRLLRKGERAPVVVAIRENPEQVAWLYTLPDQRSARVGVHLRSGRCTRVTLPADQAPAIMAELLHRAPQAVVGFNKQRLQSWKDNPAAFGKVRKRPSYSVFAK